MRRPAFSYIFIVFYALMSLVYLGVGAFFIWHPAANNVIGSPFNIYFGVGIIIYGLFRAYRTISNITANKQ